MSQTIQKLGKKQDEQEMNVHAWWKQRKMFAFYPHIHFIQPVYRAQ